MEKSSASRRASGDTNAVAAGDTGSDGGVAAAEGAAGPLGMTEAVIGDEI